MDAAEPPKPLSAYSDIIEETSYSQLCFDPSSIGAFGVGVAQNISGNFGIERADSLKCVTPHVGLVSNYIAPYLKSLDFTSKCVAYVSPEWAPGRQGTVRYAFLPMAITSEPARRFWPLEDLPSHMDHNGRVSTVISSLVHPLARSCVPFRNSIIIDMTRFLYLGL